MFSVNGNHIEKYAAGRGSRPPQPAVAAAAQQQLLRAAILPVCREERTVEGDVVPEDVLERVDVGASGRILAASLLGVGFGVLGRADFRTADEIAEPKNAALPRLETACDAA